MLLGMDVMGLTKHFIRLELIACAMGCLVLLTSTQSRSSQINALLGAAPINQTQDSTPLLLLDQLGDLENEGTSLPMAEQV